MNVKSGECAENCKYCAQSKYYSSECEVFPFIGKSKILEEVARIHASGVRIFGLVTSGSGYLTIDEEFQEILDTIDDLYQHYPDMAFCVSLGNLSDITAKALSIHKVIHYNMNIQVNPARYKELIADTHQVEERINTVKHLQKYGIKTCTGGIFGVGESMEDRIAMAFLLKALDVDVIPLNVLIPIAGTPLENAQVLPIWEVALTFALFRLILPEKIIKFAAGRETQMKDFQGLLMLSGPNGFLTGGYLTTRGRAIKEDDSLLEQIKLFS
jgi:biotin synthase